jgi:hypothetical protein
VSEMVLLMSVVTLPMLARMIELNYITSRAERIEVEVRSSTFDSAVHYTSLHHLLHLVDSVSYKSESSVHCHHHDPCFHNSTFSH